MRKQGWIYCALVSLMFFSCTDETHNFTDPEDILQDSTEVRKNGFDIEPLLGKADSLEIIYYDDQFLDTLRYSRFFSFTSSSDTAALKLVKNQFRQYFVIHNHIQVCRSQGKMILFSGSEPLKTIYFSDKKGECAYLYFIKDGKFYYFPLTEKMARYLGDSKKNTTKP